jgi:hypothetical protein
MFQLKALAKNIFKYPVCAVLPTEKLDDQGNTVFAEAHFVGKFQSASVDEGQEMAKALGEVSNNDYEGMVAAVNKQLTQVFIGFEKHPLYPMPFKDGDDDVGSSAESIKALLNSKEVRDAIQAAYNEARSKGIERKNSKKSPGTGALEA